MGKFTYGPASLEVGFEDRLLAHIRAVIVTKLRRAECFLFTWEDVSGPEPVQQSLWMHPAIGIRFEVDSAAATPLNKAWLHRLSLTANSEAGLTLCTEPEPPDSR